MLELEDILGPDGPLQRALPDFRFRPQQLRMAEHVAAALERRSTLVVEAGTGTGKTFAYLVPALLSGLRVLISTGTRTLQDQLFAKDLPLVAGAIGRPVRTALLKGRANYLCRHRLALAQTQLALEESARGARARDGMLAKVERWARTTRTGDLAEVPGLADSHSVWPLVTSTRDNCLGARCPELSRCHVLAARREAQEADVVIVNHHLLLADLALKEDGFGDILGSVYERDHVRADIVGAKGDDLNNLVGNNLQAHLEYLEKAMRDAAADLDFEEAARLRDEIKRLRETELAIMDDPLSRDAGVENTQEKRREAARKGTLRQAQGEGRRGRGSVGRPVSPLEKEMPGRAEGGAKGQAASGQSLFRKPDLDEMGTSGAHAVPARGSLFRKNSLDEMTVRRTEKPLGKTPPAAPPDDAILKRYKPGAGSYEDPVDERRRTRRPKKTGRPGQ